MRWLDKVLRWVNEDRQILNCLWQRKHRWIDLVLRHGGLTHGITEGRMKGKPTKGRRIQILHDLTNDGGFVALQRAAEDRERWRYRERMSKTCCRAEVYWRSLHQQHTAISASVDSFLCSTAQTCPCVKCIISVEQ